MARRLRPCRRHGPRHLLHRLRRRRASSAGGAGVTPRPESFSIDLSHFLNEHGDLPPDLPEAARRLALHNGAIVAWVTAVGAAVADAEHTNVSCRRGRARPPCFGTVIAHRQGDAAIAWHCDTCGEQSMVRGFEGTPWDRRRPDA